MGIRISCLNRGGAAADVVIFCAVIVFLIIPVFAAVAESAIVGIKSQIISEAVDMANLSVYNALNIEQLSRVSLVLDEEKAREIYKFVLAENLRLKEDLSPTEESLAEGVVQIVELRIISGPFPVLCPNGTELARPAVHSSVIVPIRPTLFAGAILEALGREYLECFVHMDFEFPLDR